ncbi:helix-turn-helix domain-containing protein [Sphingomonas sp. UYP23]
MTAEIECEHDRLALQISAIRSHEALGRSLALDRLLQFLFDCSVEGRIPKGVEIADQVFGKAVGNDQDSPVRVHIHRLRRKLDEYYAGLGADADERVILPKGGYRLALEPMRKSASSVETTGHVDNLSAGGTIRPFSQVLLASAGLLLLLLLVASTTWWLARRPDASLRVVRASAAWQPALTNGRKLAIVLGDFYIFGERDADGDIAQLVRRFDVNSPQDLRQFLSQNPERAPSDVDLGLDYLPLGTGGALRAVVPVVRSDDRTTSRDFVVPASQLSPEMLKLTNLVYLGYLSALGPLRDPVFSNSRFKIGGSYDEIVDRRTGKSYMAGSHLDETASNSTQDYALITCFTGVSGNWITVIAGTRDAALMQAADYATRPDGLAAATQSITPGTAFEALVAVESLRNVGLRARLIVLSPRRGEIDWSGRRSQRFPDALETSSTR